MYVCMFVCVCVWVVEIDLTNSSDEDDEVQRSPQGAHSRPLTKSKKSKGMPHVARFSVFYMFKKLTILLYQSFFFCCLLVYGHLNGA